MSQFWDPFKTKTESQKALSDLQISKIADLSSDYKFKRRSAEEQFKVNKQSEHLLKQVILKSRSRVIFFGSKRRLQ